MDSITKRLEILEMKLEAEGAYVGSNTAFLARQEILRSIAREERHYGLLGRVSGVKEVCRGLLQEARSLRSIEGADEAMARGIERAVVCVLSALDGNGRSDENAARAVPTIFQQGETIA